MLPPTRAHHRERLLDVIGRHHHLTGVVGSVAGLGVCERCDRPADVSIIGRLATGGPLVVLLCLACSATDLAGWITQALDSSRRTVVTYPKE